MVKIDNKRKTKRNRGGGPKSRRPMTVRAPESPKECAICQEMMTKPRDTKKTKCGHRFHKECMLKWCKRCVSGGLEQTCPICRQNITKDCESIQPDQPMPDKRISDILFHEDFEAHALGATGDEIQERRTRMKEFLMKLRFPKKFDYFDWNKITFFKAACDAAVNLDEVRAEFARR